MNLETRPDGLTALRCVVTYDALVGHNTNSHSNSRENEIRHFIRYSHNSGEIDTSSEINRLPGELNQGIQKKRMDSSSIEVKQRSNSKQSNKERKTKKKLGHFDEPSQSIIFVVSLISLYCFVRCNKVPPLK